MKQLITYCLVVLLIACKDKKSDTGFYMPAEWEAHEAVWLGWDEDSSFYPPVIDMINGLLPTVPVKIALRSDSFLLECKKYLSRSNIDTSAISFFVMPGERYWIRDHGATFLVNGKGELAVADFGWSLYGIEGWYNQMYNNNKDSVQKRLNKYFDKNTAVVDSMMATAEKAPIIKSNIINEGGAIEVNGKGTLILCEAVIMQRNPGKTKEELETGFKKALGVSKIIWLKQGLIEDAHLYQLHFAKYSTMGTGGHTDEFVRFADPHTILLAWVDEKEADQHPFNKVNYERMKENLRILESSTDQDGKPFQIIKVPLPDIIQRQILVKEKLGDGDSINVLPRYFLPAQRPKTGDTLMNVAASSYLNYLISNGVVLLPGYLQEGSSAEKENKVKEIFARLFPDRKLVWVNCMPQNWNGGGIHCSTQQQPKRIMK